MRERCPGASDSQPSGPISRLVVDLHPRAFALRYRGTPRGCSIRSRMLYRGRRGPMCCFWPSSPATPCCRCSRARPWSSLLPCWPPKVIFDIVFVVAAAAFGALLSDNAVYSRGLDHHRCPLHPRRPHRYYVPGGDGGHALEAAIPSRRRHRRRDVVAVRIGARLPRWRVV